MASKNNPYWYKLIKLLKVKGEIKPGLTIPYIFGAYEVLGKPFKNIAELIEHVTDAEIDKYPAIGMCDTIHQDVLGVYQKSDCTKWENVGMIQSDSGNGRLYTTPESNLGESKETMIARLNNLYEIRIKNKTYSWSNSKKDWFKFSDKEKELILSIK